MSVNGPVPTVRSLSASLYHLLGKRILVVTRRAYVISAAAYALIALVLALIWKTDVDRLGTLLFVSLFFIALYAPLYVSLLTAIGVGFCVAATTFVKGRVVTLPFPIDLAIIELAAVSTVLGTSQLHRLLRYAERSAGRDALTETANRRYFMKHIREMIAKGRRFAVLFADLDGFKEINDKFGHEVGDKALVAAARRIGHQMRNSDVLARHGGDEFCMALGNIQSRNDAERAITNIEKAFEERFTIGTLHFDLGISIGMSVFPDDERREERLLSVADADMYARKRNKRSNSND